MTVLVRTRCRSLSRIPKSPWDLVPDWVVPRPVGIEPRSNNPPQGQQRSREWQGSMLGGIIIDAHFLSKQSTVQY